MTSRTTIPWLTICLALLATHPALAADPLDALIGADQAESMGLSKLSVEERAALARWIERRLQGRPVPMSSPTVAFAFDGVTVQAQVVPAGVATPAAATAPSAAMERQVDARAPVAIGSAAAFGLDQKIVDGDHKELRARILGEFTGWEGKTLFKLDNGQVWRQSTSGVYRHKATDPEVVIEQGLVGYKLRVVETKRSIAVRRIK
jgi:hypothetical protein